MRKIKLTRSEKEIEGALAKGEYVSAGKMEYGTIAKALESRRKDAVLNIRINSGDLEMIKAKAGKLGVKYQSLITEILRNVARA
jgi:predicted DNA binding CopG/RHH family protein